MTDVPRSGQIGEPTVGPADAADSFSVAREQRARLEVILLRDSAARTEARVVPALGNACVAFTIEVNDGRWSVLAEPITDDEFLHRTTRFGVPILYPWPNRVRDGRFTFRGRQYVVPANSPGGHANHGLARGRPWTVDQSGVDAAGAYVRSVVTIGDDPTDPFPFPSRLAVEHRLRGGNLSIQAEAINLGQEPMPMGFGLHPWFGLPFGLSGDRATCRVAVPASSIWELEDSIPTGRVVPASGRLDLRTLTPLGTEVFDDVFTDLEMSAAGFAARVHDPATHRTVTLHADGGFQHHVLFAPSERDVVCLEPYTCPTDAFNLEARGIAAGVIVLEPGQSWRGSVVIAAAED